MQHDFLDVGAPCEIPSGRNVISNIQKLAGEARSSRVPVIHVYTVWRRDGSDVPRFTTTEEIRNGLREGSRGAEIVEQLRPISSDYRVVKKRYSGFYQTDLELLLRKLSVNDVIVTGVATNYCVSSTVRDACFRDIMSYVPRECVAALTKEEQDVSLHDIESGFGKVISVEDAVRMVRGVREGTETPKIINVA